MQGRKSGIALQRLDLSSTQRNLLQKYKQTFSRRLPCARRTHMSDIEIYMYEWHFYPFLRGLCTLYVSPHALLLTYVAWEHETARFPPFQFHRQNPLWKVTRSEIVTIEPELSENGSCLWMLNYCLRPFPFVCFFFFHHPFLFTFDLFFYYRISFLMIFIQN